MFQVEGYVNGVSYAVRFGANPELDAERTERVGGVIGSGRALDVLRQFEGIPVLVTPTGPSILGSLSDPAGVLAVLTTQTEVTSVTGDDIPELTPAGDPGVVY